MKGRQVRRCRYNGLPSHVIPASYRKLTAGTDTVLLNQGKLCKSAKGLCISTKGGAPYRGEGGLHGANHNEVEDNSITISKNKMFSLGRKCSLISITLNLILT